VLVHLGSSNYLDRYKIYVTHLQEWQQQFDKLESVDLRYDRQIIVNPDLQGPMKQPPLSTDAAKKAMAAGVKPAALITRIPSTPRPTPTLEVRTVGPAPTKPTPAKPVATVKTAVKTAKAPHRKPHVHRARGLAKPGTRTKIVRAAKTQPKIQTKAAPKSGATVKPTAKPSPAIAKGETQ
jgi:cell division protein FtsQ